MSTVRVLDHATAVQGGVEHFVRSATLDMDALARELAVSRATLYRTVGSRDALLGHVLAAIGCWIVERTMDDPVPAGADGVIEVSRRFAEALERAEPLRRFAQREPDVAHRVLLAPTGRVHALTVAVQRDLFRRVGGLDPGPTPDGPRLPTQHDPTSRAGTRPTTAPPTTAPPPTPLSATPRATAASPPDPLIDRAFLYVSVLEAVLYGPLLAGRRPDFGLAEPARRALLR